jgi:hypothetical protein
MGKDYQSDDRPAETQYESPAEGAPRPSDQTPPDSLLEEVLQHTIPAESEPLSEDELSALQDVARRHASAPFACDPTGVALIECLLQLRLPIGVREITPEMPRDIAEAIFDAPEARHRLSQLWDQLCESVR